VSAVQNEPVTLLESSERKAQHANPCLLAHSFLAATSFSSKQMGICCVCNYVLLSYSFVLQIRNANSSTVPRHILRYTFFTLCELCTFVWTVYICVNCVHLCELCTFVWTVYILCELCTFCVNCVHLCELCTFVWTVYICVNCVHAILSKTQHFISRLLQGIKHSVQ
jgi:hypothetical protein